MKNFSALIICLLLTITAYSQRVKSLDESGKATFKLDASSEDGLFIKNPFDKELELYIKPVGEVCININDRKNSTSNLNGIYVRDKRHLLYPYNVGALVGINEKGEHFFVGEGKIFYIAPKEVIKLVVNDCKGCFGDNSGIVDIKIEHEKVK